MGRIFFPCRRASSRSSCKQVGVQGIGRIRWNRACPIRHETQLSWRIRWNGACSIRHAVLELSWRIRWNGACSIRHAVEDLLLMLWMVREAEK